MMRKVSGWGRYPIAETEWLAPSSPSAVLSATKDRDGIIARGNGRAYGDAAIGLRSTLVMTGLDRIIRIRSAVRAADGRGGRASFGRHCYFSASRLFSLRRAGNQTHYDRRRDRGRCPWQEFIIGKAALEITLSS